MQDVVLCAPQPVQVSSLSAINPGSAALRVDNYVADAARATLSGIGEVALTGPPAGSAHVAFSGSGSVQAAARKADVSLQGMGDIYITGVQRAAHACAHARENNRA